MYINHNNINNNNNNKKGTAFLLPIELSTYSVGPKRERKPITMQFTAHTHFSFHQNPHKVLATIQNYSLYSLFWAEEREQSPQGSSGTQF